MSTGVMRTITSSTHQSTNTSQTWKSTNSSTRPGKSKGDTSKSTNCPYQSKRVTLRIFTTKSSKSESSPCLKRKRKCTRRGRKTLQNFSHRLYNPDSHHRADSIVTQLFVGVRNKEVLSQPEWKTKWVSTKLLTMQASIILSSTVPSLTKIWSKPTVFLKAATISWTAEQARRSSTRR